MDDFIQFLIIINNQRMCNNQTWNAINNIPWCNVLGSIKGGWDMWGMMSKQLSGAKAAAQAKLNLGKAKSSCQCLGRQATVVGSWYGTWGYHGLPINRVPQNSWFPSAVPPHVPWVPLRSSTRQTQCRYLDGSEESRPFGHAEGHFGDGGNLRCGCGFECSAYFSLLPLTECMFESHSSFKHGQPVMRTDWWLRSHLFDFHASGVYCCQGAVCCQKSSRRRQIGIWADCA